jgi:hypothetical protein
VSSDRSGASRNSFHPENGLRCEIELDGIFSRLQSWLKQGMVQVRKNIDRLATLVVGLVGKSVRYSFIIVLD